jgi:hypothetical protein
VPAVTLASSLGATVLAGLLLFWSTLPVRWRRASALLASVAGLAFLMVAFNSEGLRETPSTAVFLLGTPYVTSQAAASAGLPYYVLTGLFLMLGTLGLALGDRGAEVLAERPMTTAVGVSLLVLFVRFLLEKTAAPEPLAHLFGVTWLTPMVGAFFWIRQPRPPRVSFVAGRLLLYGLAVRAAATAIYVAATVLNLGSHYDVRSLTNVRTPWGTTYHFVAGSFAQLTNLVLIPQLVIWPIYTVISGLIGAGVAAVIAGAWQRSTANP